MKLMKSLRVFRHDDKGAVGMIFGLALVPLMGLTGVSVDYSRASAVRNELQIATDATVLALAKDSVLETAAQYNARAQAFFNANWNGRLGARLQTLTVTKLIDKFKIDARAEVDYSIMRIFGVNNGVVAASATAGWGLNKIEIALVLDNTGSMLSANKMQELKKALCGDQNCSNPNSTTGFVAQMKAAALFPDQIRVALVPFDTMVRVPTTVQNTVNSGTPTNTTFAYTGAGYCAPNPTSAQRISWFRFAARDKNGTDWSASAPCDMALKPTPANWQGCIWDRDQDSNRDTKPTGVDPLGTETLYPTSTCRSPSFARMAPLVDVRNPTNAANLISALGSMTPVGMTNLTIGVNWGANMLTPGLPMSTAIVQEPNLRRFMILLTDGDNTENRQGTWQKAAHDARTRLACTEAKKPVDFSKPDEAIKIYSIRVINGNQALLKDCSSGPGYYFEVAQASDLNQVFKNIAGQISAIRLTN